MLIPDRPFHPSLICLHKPWQYLCNYNAIVFKISNFSILSTILAQTFLNLINFYFFKSTVAGERTIDILVNFHIISLYRWAIATICNKYYFSFEFKIQMWVWVDHIFERDQIPICYLSNKSNLNKDKPNIFECDQNKQMFAKGWKTEIELFTISHYFSINIIFYHFLQIYHLKFGSMESVFMINGDLNNKLFI